MVNSNQKSSAVDLGFGGLAFTSLNPWEVPTQLLQQMQQHTSPDPLDYARNEVVYWKNRFKELESDYIKTVYGSKEKEVKIGGDTKCSSLLWK